MAGKVIDDYAVVLSNDIVDDTARMLEVCVAAEPYVDAVKIGITSSMVPGVDVFERAKTAMNGKPVLADYKVADIGFRAKDESWQGTNAKILRALTAADASYITVHTFPGLSSIEEAIAVAHETGGRVLTLPYMTHKGADLFFGMPLDDAQHQHIDDALVRYGIDVNQTTLRADLAGCGTITDVILMLGQHFGVDGFIAPANNPTLLRRYRERTDGELWCPGFGRQSDVSMDAQFENWARIVGPNSAAIVGSAIYKDEDPARAAEEIRAYRDQAVARLTDGSR
jgi:orotidine-5'-phosphate decarboxylase